MLKKFFKRLAAWISIFTASTAGAYDNTRSPPFEASLIGRGFQNISIHPNGEEWLISEYSDAFTPYSMCYLLIYNLKDHTYQRLDLPKNYSYVEANFSQSGEQIVFVRQPPSTKGGHADIMNSYANGEIVIMNRDGSGYRVLPIPRNRIVGPTLSPSGEKLAYLVASSDKPRSRGMHMAFFEIWEFDFKSGEHQLFAGPINFYHAAVISYLSESEIIAGAIFPEHTGTVERPDYLNQYRGSEIFRIKRGMRFAPEPSYYDLAYAKFPTIDLQGDIFYQAEVAKVGISLVRKNHLDNTTVWREPLMNMASVSQYVAAPAGDYVGFIYGGPPLRTKQGTSALGYFDLKTEKWIPVIPPLVSESTLIPLKLHH